MNKVVFYVPDVHTCMMNDLRKIPFAKMDDGYRFAYWVYDLNNSDEKRVELLESPNGERAMGLLLTAKKAIEDIVITEDDYLAWSVHKKETGGVKRYHDVIHDLSVSLLMLSIDLTAEQIENEDHRPEDFFYTVHRTQSNDTTKQVLNRNNPFADVTIKSQQFFYKTAEGSTETLFFNTNNIVEKMNKNNKDLFTMRPGFSVTKEHGVVQRPMQKVTFSSSITEPIVGDEDHIYIHID